MKKTLLLAALTMAAAPAFASKARLNALGNADHLDDIQRVFDRPYQAAGHGELATIEFGPSTAPTATTTSLSSPTITAEGGFVRQMGDANYLGAYVGHMPSALVDGTTGFLSSTIGIGLGSLTAAQREVFLSTLNNTISVFWASKTGDMEWGVQAFYMATANNTPGTAAAGYSANLVGTKNRQGNVAGISVGVDTANFDVDLSAGLQGKLTYLDSADLTNTLNSTANYLLHGTYKMDTLKIFGKYGMSSAATQVTNATDIKADVTGMSVGVIDSRKKDGNEFFYGASYVMSTLKTNPTAGDRKIEIAALPLIVGVEAEAASWLVLRGSFVQNLLGSSKTTIGNTNNPTLTAVNTETLNGSTVGAGAGFKFGKFTLDTFLAAAVTGTVSLASDTATGAAGDKFLTQASLTYLF